MSSALSTPEPRAVQAVTLRELFTVARSRSPLALFVGLSVAVAGIAVFGGQPRYLPTVADLLLPIELLVPTVAIALGYRPIAADAQRGELPLLETYPVSHGEYVLGVFLGRAAALVTMLVVPLLAVGVYLATTSPDVPTLFATQQGTDSPIAFARFVVLTVLFGLTILALAIALSALARSKRTALVLGGAVLVFVVVVFDLLILRGFTTGALGRDSLITFLAVSPTSAYRGLVFETVLSTTGPGAVQAAPLLNILGLLAWLLVSLGLTVVALGRE
jgi:ABC-type transport system involved in multi-copper enzyme maturation permease subunit